VVGDVGPSLALLGDRLDLEGKLQTAAALLRLRKEILARNYHTGRPRTAIRLRIVHDVRQVMPTRTS
jgi:acetolactate synthase I/II/III large subunit